MLFDANFVPDFNFFATSNPDTNELGSGQQALLDQQQQQLLAAQQQIPNALLIQKQQQLLAQTMQLNNMVKQPLDVLDGFPATDLPVQQEVPAILASAQQMAMFEGQKKKKLVPLIPASRSPSPPQNVRHPSPTNSITTLKSVSSQDQLSVLSDSDSTSLTTEMVTVPRIEQDILERPKHKKRRLCARKRTELEVFQDNARLDYLKKKKNKTEIEKKELRTLRNRFSAQKSRNKRKMMKEEKENKIKNLETENAMLKARLEHVLQERDYFKNLYLSTQANPEKEASSSKKRKAGLYAFFGLCIFVAIILTLSVGSSATIEMPWKRTKARQLSKVVPTVVQESMDYINQPQEQIEGIRIQVKPEPVQLDVRYETGIDSFNETMTSIHTDRNPFDNFRIKSDKDVTLLTPSGQTHSKKQNIVIVFPEDGEQSPSNGQSKYRVARIKSQDIEFSKDLYVIDQEKKC